jgi:predicted PurR-regulated permease PerM
MVQIEADRPARTATQDILHLASDKRGQGLARLALSLALVAFGLYVISGYVRALVWAVIFAIALSRLYRAVHRRTPEAFAGEALPAVFTLLTGAVFLLPFALFAIEAVRELNQLVDYGRQVGDSGIPAPDFLARLPFGSTAVGWWNVHLAHQGWFTDFIRQVNTSSNRELGRTLGASVVHRIFLFGVSLLALFFLFRDGRSVTKQFLIAADRLFGSRGERVARQMAASVHGTVNGLILVGLGEGVLLGGVFFLFGVPHALLFAALTAFAAMVPLVAYFAVIAPILILAATGGVVSAAIVAGCCVVVIFLADHFVRPTLIGGATKLPFLWVLLGILGGLETFQLLGLFLGPAIMAAVMLLWRDLVSPQQEI